MKLSGELGTVVVSFAAVSAIKLGSTILLTRILYPEAYGIMALLGSVIFVVEMISDLGVMTLMIRHAQAEEHRYLDTLWTIRFLRGLLNASLVFLAAPWLARMYGAPELDVSLRVFSVWFLLQGLESMSFLRAIRQKNSRLYSYSELASLVLSTGVSIALSWLWRDHFGMIAGMLVNRLAMTALSYCFHRDHRPRIALDREISRELFQITKFVLPSSVLTMAMTQYDKVIFLKLFNLQMLGLYGLAGAVIQSVDAIVIRVTRFVLYPRCAEKYRQDPGRLVQAYYVDNMKLQTLIVVLPAIMLGGGQFLVSLIFDARYEFAGFILQMFAVRSLLLAFYSSAEDLLVATGENHIGLTGNVLRVAWLIPASLAGYYFFGFVGFLVLTAFDLLPALAFYLWLQRRKGFLVLRYEVMKLGFALSLALLTWVLCSQLLPVALDIRRALIGWI